VKLGDLVRLVNPHAYAGGCAPNSIGLVLEVKKEASNVGGNWVAEVAWNQKPAHTPPSGRNRYLSGSLEVISEAG
jgi:hypothetical protein